MSRKRRKKLVDNTENMVNTDEVSNEFEVETEPFVEEKTEENVSVEENSSVENILENENNVVPSEENIVDEVKSSEEVTEEIENVEEIENNVQENENTSQEEKEENKKKKPNKFVVIGLCVLLFLMVCVSTMMQGDNIKEGSLTYNEFMSEVENKNIDYVLYDSTSHLIEVTYKEGVCQEEYYDEETGELKELVIVDNRRIETVINPSDEDFYKYLALHDVDLKIKDTTSTTIMVALLGYLPTFLLMGILIWYMYSTFKGGMGQKKKPTAVKSTTKFSDVAGMTEEKEELLFAIRSLKNSEEYVAKGVKPVRGILLEGPPGVGKTLLAKAVAGEAGVNFLSYSGADFVEMFVGLGARRIRNMYEEAEKQKPCVVFIDEIDALGKTRISGNGSPGNQEADQTLVALLERMDGMNTTSGILFIAATNRVDSLDSALLRPGRFDKTIHIGPPKTKEDREAIIEVHSKGKHFEDGVTTEKIGKLCYGLTGAEIAAALNDAVLESFKAERQGIISLDDIDKAIMKLFARGLAKGRHSDKDLKRVAVHEVGHALMNRYLGRTVVKVSIQPYSSGVGGVTQVDGENSGFEGLRTKSDLENDIKTLYAGKVAEEIIFGECSIGASNDLDRATHILKDYIGAYGMQEGNYLSLVGLSRENMMISANETLLEDMKKTAKQIYSEVVKYFSNDEVKEKLQNIADVLVEKEVIYDLEEFFEEEVEEKQSFLEKVTEKVSDILDKKDEENA